MGFAQVHRGQPSETFLIAEGNYMDIEPITVSRHYETGLIYRHYSRGGELIIPTGNVWFFFDYGVSSMTYFDGHSEHRAYEIPHNMNPDGYSLNEKMAVEAPW